MSVGAEYYVNGSGKSIVTTLKKGESFVVAPGQFAYILTKEKVYISHSAIGFISIRASVKFRGLVNVSGFQVNPGFRGNLVFAIFNAGPRTVNIREGDEIFSLWIADLDGPIDGDYENSGKIPNDMDRIPSDVINGIAGDALTAYQLSEKLAALDSKVSNLTGLFYYAGLILVLIVGILATVYSQGLYEKLMEADQNGASVNCSAIADENCAKKPFLGQ